VVVVTLVSGMFAAAYALTRLLARIEPDLFIHGGGEIAGVEVDVAITAGAAFLSAAYVTGLVVRHVQQ
jgi:hypothetical protein